MLNFKNTITLDKKIAVIIPKGLEYSDFYIKDTADMFTQFFGGATLIDISGSYFNQFNNIDFDYSTMVYAYYQEMDEMQEETIVNYVENMREQLEQECIGMEIEGKFVMVFGEE